MTDAATFQLVIGGMQAVPALLWGTASWRVARFMAGRRPNPRAYGVLLVFCALVTWHYALWTFAPLLPAHLSGERNLTRGVVFALVDGGVVALLGVARHFALVWPLRADPPSRGWLAVNYGLTGVVGVFFVLADLRCFDLPAAGTASFFALFTVYLLCMGALTVRDVRRLARRVPWRAGAGGLADLGASDAVAASLGLACIGAGHVLPALAGTSTMALTIHGEPSAAGFAAYALHALAGLILAMPVVIRNAVDTLRAFATVLAAIVLVGAGYVGGRVLAGAIADPESRRLAELGIVLAVVLLVPASRLAIDAAVDRLVLRRHRNRWAELHATLQTLSPELGVVESCRRALAAVAGALQLRAAAILLADGQTVVHGTLDVEPLRRAWPRTPEELPARSFGISGFRALPRELREALIEADVAVVIPVVSPRRHWGWAFASTSILGASFADEDDRGVDAAAKQMALLLDGAELLARAVGVERSLAHAEKLTAIGELVARVAHDIRNPITAARSLAQQLAREPGGPFAEEHALILEELGRVDRQVAALLRFSRREEPTLAPLDLAALARETLAALRPRLDATGVRVVLDAGTAVTARAERERLRQVLINLIENACDAMAAGPPATRALTVTVANGGAAGVVRVVDSGPGVPTEALAHLFEPFYSTKPHGTGLGLAIARRTVEAHGGRLTAHPAATGMAFEIELPLAEEP
jgi:signal transduction histidine kinase